MTTVFACPQCAGLYAQDPLQASTIVGLADLAERQRWGQLNQRLADAPDSVSERQPDGMTALHWAVFHGHAAAIDGLLAAGADVDAVTRYQIRPLAIACSRGDSQAVSKLLAANPSFGSRGPNHETPLMITARQGNPQVMGQLLAAGAVAEVVDQSGQSALMWAAAAGHAEIVQRLIDAGADPQRRLSGSGFTPLFFAARQGHVEVTETLLRAGVAINDVMQVEKKGGRWPISGSSALMLAVESGHFELALRLVQLGADPNDQRRAVAPLHLVSTVRRPNSGDGFDGDPPPRGSASVNSLEFVRRMVELGADVNLQLSNARAPAHARLNPKLATPLLYACKTADLPLIRVLVELGADIHLANADGVTPILAAAGVGTTAVGEEPGTAEEVLQVLTYLLERGADLHAVTAKNDTAMHGAAFRDHPPVAEFLHKQGLSARTWNRKNQFGWSPFDIADGKRPGSVKPSPEFRRTLEAALSAD